MTLIYYSILQEELQPVRLAYQLGEHVLPYSQPNPNEPSNQNQLTALQEAGELIRQHMVENAKVFHNKITQSRVQIQQRNNMEFGWSVGCRCGTHQ